MSPRQVHAGQLRRAARDATSPPAAPDAGPDVQECCWCDEDTPSEARFRSDVLDGQGAELVFSDEFNTPGRSFANGDDARWTALDMADDTNAAQAYFDPSAVTTVVDEDDATPGSGLLRITTKLVPGGMQGKPIQSGQVQGWNKFCFTGGSVEVRFRLGKNAACWPSIWLLGNLGRAVHQRSNAGVWPWSYDACYSDLQLPAGAARQRYVGRGAPEIDLIEAVVSKAHPDINYASFSLQVAPRLPPALCPIAPALPASAGNGTWYDGLVVANGATINNFWYGPDWSAWGVDWRYPRPKMRAPVIGQSRATPGYVDAVSANLAGKAARNLGSTFHTIRLDWQPSDGAGPGGGYLRWFLDDALVFEVPEGALNKTYAYCYPGGAGDGGGGACCFTTPPRLVPDEASYVILSQTVSPSWGKGLKGLEEKTTFMDVDYVRVYQARDQRDTGCSPPRLPTKDLVERGLRRGEMGEAVRPPGAATCPGVHAVRRRAHEAKGGHHCRPYTAPFADRAVCWMDAAYRERAVAFVAITVIWTLAAVCICAGMCHRRMQERRRRKWDARLH